MSTETDSATPQTESTPQRTPQPGFVYGDERHANDGDGPTYPEQFQIVFIDDNRVLMKNLKSADYRFEIRRPFDRAVGNRWTLLKTPDHDESDVMNTPDIAPYVSLLNHQRDKHEQETTESAPNKVEALTNAINILKSHTPQEMDWAEVDGVGPKTAENLKARGFSTDADVSIATDTALLKVSGMGEKTVANLRDHIED